MRACPVALIDPVPSNLYRRIQDRRRPRLTSEPGQRVTGVDHLLSGRRIHRNRPIRGRLNRLPERPTLDLHPEPATQAQLVQVVEQPVGLRDNNVEPSRRTQPVRRGKHQRRRMLTRQIQRRRTQRQRNRTRASGIDYHVELGFPVAVPRARLDRPVQQLVGQFPVDRICVPKVRTLSQTRASTSPRGCVRPSSPGHRTAECAGMSVIIAEPDPFRPATAAPLISWPTYLPVSLGAFSAKSPCALNASPSAPNDDSPRGTRPSLLSEHRVSRRKLLAHHRIRAHIPRQQRTTLSRVELRLIHIQLRLRLAREIRQQLQIPRLQQRLKRRTIQPLTLQQSRQEPEPIRVPLLLLQTTQNRRERRILRTKQIGATELVRDAVPQRTGSVTDAVTELTSRVQVRPSGRPCAARPHASARGVHASAHDARAQECPQHPTSHDYADQPR